jgi:hypothetical protein
MFRIVPEKRAKVPRKSLISNDVPNVPAQKVITKKKSKNSFCITVFTQVISDEKNANNFQNWEFCGILEH